MNQDIGSITAAKNVGSENMGANICNAKVEIPKKLKAEGVTDQCMNYGNKICEKCQKTYCHWHIKEGKHECLKGFNTTTCRKCGKEKIKDGFSTCEECIEDE